MKTPKKNLDYIEIYSERLKNDNSLFDQHKRFIESQLKASSSLFKEAFPETEFKELARRYLKGRLLIR